MTVEEARRAGVLPRSRRVKKVQLPYSQVPHACVTLGIDCGKTSGWGVLLRGGKSWESFLYPPGSVRVMYGQSSDPDDWWLAICWARDLAKLHGVPLVPVFETWTQGNSLQDRRMRALVLLGLGETRGEWKRLLKAAKIPKCRSVFVNAMTWRSKLIGGRMSRPRSEWKALALARVRGQYEGMMESTLAGGQLGEDAAEGVCVAEYGAYAGNVGEVVKRAGKRTP